ncbi:Omp28-related outer membrane protein [uncultured Lutibacter sp.]|uniref:Omp28-related outer membrane protein n=1 Tax=uncultured Lutibacter sp. TaxID=437739 RepID=UPI0026155B1E|nr:Omp28-related outer membrane protein [uncultured Lutibacter sp.]
MKTNQLFSFLMLSLAFLVSSCSGSSDDIPEVNATSILITSNKLEVDLGETLTFSVKDNLDVNLTSTASIYFNNTVITGTSYTPSQDGTFAIRAEYEGLKSSSIYVKVNAVNTLSSIVVSSSSKEILLGETVTLSAVGNEGTDFTNEATYFVNGLEIAGITYAPSKRGSEILTATYSGLASNEVNLLTGYKQKVLIEDFTGTWCGWCPRVSYAIELVEAVIDASITVAIHSGSTDSNNGYYDPYTYPNGSVFGVNSYPTAKLNRKSEWNSPETSYVSQVKNLVENGGVQRIKNIGLKIASTLTNNTLDIKVNSGIIGDLDGEKLVVYILENGLNYNQENYTTYFGGQSVLSNFEHNKVLRQVPTDLFGDAITSGDYDTTSNTYEKTFSVDLFSSIENKANLEVVAFIVDSSGRAVNVQVSAVGETKDFE